MRAWTGAGWLLALLCVVSCAEGYEGLSSLKIKRAPPSTGAGNPSRVDGGSGMAGSGPMMTPPTATGVECGMGETMTCTCASTGTEGVHQCKADKRSSKGGYFAEECTRCAPPMVMEPDPGDVTMTDAGAAGSSGSSAASGSGGMSGSSAGSGGSGGSRAPSGGSGGRSGSCMPACNNVCFPVGILACCRPIGGCGCTWAPGAYCF